MPQEKVVVERKTFSFLLKSDSQEKERRSCVAWQGWTAIIMIIDWVWLLLHCVTGNGWSVSGLPSRLVKSFITSAKALKRRIPEEIRLVNLTYESNEAIIREKWTKFLVTTQVALKLHKHKKLKDTNDSDLTCESWSLILLEINKSRPTDPRRKTTPRIRKMRKEYPLQQEPTDMMMRICWSSRGHFRTNLWKENTIVEDAGDELELWKDLRTGGWLL